MPDQVLEAHTSLMNSTCASTVLETTAKPQPQSSTNAHQLLWWLWARLCYLREAGLATGCDAGEGGPDGTLTRVGQANLQQEPGGSSGNSSISSRCHHGVETPMRPVPLRASNCVLKLHSHNWQAAKVSCKGAQCEQVCCQ